jgi:uncharacterized protein YprB with RNaseH-like and TPR domain
MSKPKVLFLDIETTPNLGYTWGKYEQTVLKFVKEGYILSFVGKWLRGPFVLGFAKDANDKKLVNKLWNLLDEADIVIAHNGDRFDIKMINAGFLKHGLKPPSPYRTVDTLKVLRRHFRMNSNRLDDIGKVLNIGEKIKHEGIDLWLKCMSGDQKAIDRMFRYNRQDVTLLEKVYFKILPWISNHPNYNNYTEKQVCPRCGAKKTISKGGVITGSRQYQRRMCVSCGGYFKVPTKGGSKPVLAL